MNLSAPSPRPTVGERVELDRYTVAGAERILYGQRIDGVVRITDRPASGSGRSYLIEIGLEQDGYAALKALVADYTLCGYPHSTYARPPGSEPSLWRAASRARRCSSKQRSSGRF